MLARPDQVDLGAGITPASVLVSGARRRTRRACGWHPARTAGETGVGDPRQEASDFARLAPGLVREGLPGVRVPAAPAPESPVLPGIYQSVTLSANLGTLDRKSV